MRSYEYADPKRISTFLYPVAIPVVRTVLLPSHLIAIPYNDSGTPRVRSTNLELDASIAIAGVSPVSPVALSPKSVPFLGATSTRFRLKYYL